MGKTSDFERRENDTYDTWDTRAVKPLSAFFMPGAEFIEPCAGRGALVDQLRGMGLVCTEAFDIVPRRSDIATGNVFDRRFSPADRVITNAPFFRPVLNAVIDHVSPQCELWLLAPASWLFTHHYRRHGGLLHFVLPIGRLRWIEGTKHDHKEDCAWYRFGPGAPTHPIIYPRT